jgi:hypothetical protein
MKKTLLMVGALLALTAGIASAQGGINLGWGDCGPSPTAKTFSCTTNTLTGAIMVASAVAPVALDQLNGEESEFLLQTNAAALSNWWHIEAGGCRGTTAASVNFDFTGGPFTCADAWQGQAAGGMNYEANYLGAPNRARLRTIGAIPGSTSITTDEYYYFKVTLLGAKSTGTGSCAGCTDGMCIVFTQLKLTEPLGVGDYTITAPLAHQYVTWQAGGTLAGLCPAATPTSKQTWGGVKALYR